MDRLGPKLLFLGALIVGCVTSGACAQDDPGFVREWLAIGNWGDLGPDDLLVRPDDLPFEGQALRGRLWTVVTARDDGFVDLNVLGPTAPEAALAFLYVHSESTRRVRVLVGSDDRAHVYLNGRQILRSAETSFWRPDQEVVEARFNKGWNKLLLRAESRMAAFGFSLRFALPDGRPTRLKTSTAVPEEWLDQPAVKHPLSGEQVDELLDVLNYRIASAAGQTTRALFAWQTEGDCLEPEYARARGHAVAYVQALRDVLRSLSPAPDPAEEPERAARAAAARKRLMDAALAGPYQLTARTRSFLDRAERSAALWEMVKFAAGSAMEAGRQAADLDRALTDARALLAALRSEYLRPYRLRERTLRHRTAEVRVKLLAHDGRPIANAQLAVEQLSHDFLFGCNLFALGRFDFPAEEQTYQEHFLRLFNLGVVPVYWSLVEPTEGRRDLLQDSRGLPGPRALVDWARSRDLKILATSLLAADTDPVWLRTKSQEEAARLAEAHVADLVARFKGQVDYWQVIDNAYPTLVLGKARLQVPDAFRWAHRADPGAHLLLAHYAAHPLGKAAEQGQREPFGLDGLLLTEYQTGDVLSPEQFEARLDQLARAALPVHVGMVMIPGPAKDEALQAQQVEQFYRTAFAHPAVQSVAWADLSDRFAYRGAPGGLLRKDLTPKPAYLTLVRLIRDEWWTSAAGRTDADGLLGLRGFFGRYRVRAILPDESAAVWDFDLEPLGPREIVLTQQGPEPEAASGPPQQ